MAKIADRFSEALNRCIVPLHNETIHLDYLQLFVDNYNKTRLRYLNYVSSKK
jgi:hypothetical protein